MHSFVRLLADIASARLVEMRGDRRLLRARRLEPQRRIDFSAPLHAQARLLDDASVVFLRRFPLGAPESLGHSDEIMPLGLGDQARQRQQFAPLFLREAQ